MSDTIYLTADGAEDLRRELDKLLNVRRPELARKLSEAVAQGDLKENADYHDAKEQQAFIEGRIKYLENVLHKAVIITNDGSANGVIGVGSEVVIVEDGTDIEESYIIVGAAEANPEQGKISNVSPIGSALLGHKKGDKISVTTPGGNVMFKVKRVK
jgi:transcription elongation factor GreA